MALGADGVTNKNLVAFAKAKLAFTPKDQFDKGFDDSALEGRHFEIKVPLSGPNKQKSSVNFTYNADEEALTFTIWPEPNSIHHDDGAYYGPRFDYMITHSEETFGEPQVMSNAFGVEKSVTPTFITQIGVGSFKGDYMGAVPRDKVAASGEIISLAVGTKTLKMSPTDARSATADIWLEIKGVVRRPTEGHIIECDESTKKASLARIPASFG